jgi:RNA polymerase primary sigma factor
MAIKKLNKQSTKPLSARARRRHIRRQAKLTPAERQVYKTIPEDLDYVDHKSFSKAATEKKLWGPDRERIEVLDYSLFPEDVDPRKTRQSISGDQERTLFLRYNYAKYRVVREMKRQRKYYSHKRAKRIVHWYRRAQSTRKQIVHANLALVPSMAKRKSVSGVQFSELMSEGYMAVLRSAERFDVSRGFKFSTYACRSIISAFQYLGKKAQRNRQRFGAELDENHEESDFGDRRHESQRKNFIDTLHDVIYHNQADLNDVEWTIIHERYPLEENRRGKTLSQVGKKVGLTNERVRQIEKKTLKKLKEAFVENQVSV